MPRVKTFNPDTALETAMQLFWKQGYHATSMDDLVDTMGINRSSIYSTYGGKQELFNKALEHYSATTHQNLQNYFASQKDVRQAIRKLFRSAIKTITTNPKNRGCLVLNTTAELIPGDAATRDIVVTNRVDMRAVYQNALKEGVKRGEIRKDADIKTVALMLFTLLNGMQATKASKTTATEHMKSVEAALSLLD